MDTSIPKTLPRCIWHFCRRYPWYLLGMLFVAVYWAANLSLHSYALKLILDAVVEAGGGPLWQRIIWPAALYLGLGIAIETVFRCHDWLMLKTFSPMKKDIVEECFEYLEGHSYSYFQDHLSGSLANKVQDLSKGIADIGADTFEYFIARAAALFIGVLFMYAVHPSFAIALSLWSMIFILSSFIFSKRLLHYSEEHSEARSTVIGRLVDSFSNILSVKLFAAEGAEKLFMTRGLEDVVAKEQRSYLQLLKVKAFYGVSFVIIIAVMLALLIYEHSLQRVTVGDFALILTLMITLIEQFWFVALHLTDFYEKVGVCKQALTILSAPQKIVDLPQGQPLEVTHGKIAFENVHFHYRSGQSIFTNKSVVIAPGEKVGLIGHSGSGKSTFVNLILRFFDVIDGRILIDGQDIKKVSQSSLRRHIAMIPQDPLLFHRTLLENIRLGRPDATFDEVVASAVAAHCHEFIEKLPEQYDTLVGERGVKLSGGQRQRIAIARAILKAAPILILDEATAALDSLTENYIQQSLSQLMKGRTTIAIAHRLSTLFQMDRLLVFDHGLIVEEGSHAQLLAHNGHYSALWKMQAGGFLYDPANGNL